MALFVALARASERRSADFSAQELANTAWAFARAFQRDVALFVALARAAQQRLGESSPYAFANKAWAFATATQ